ncbi:restriction endonuclease subunit S [Luteimonas sp. 100069]|uniref:restriction endonuclease subunit S n=1 Tax=Luteimonas sp. 100069 TaxID=2006109 RepID=UPI000F4ECBEB|nr:restriction endonuclease subunit S [Luteimonas sp. 100069]RPD88420.1 restriction endonuclease subunit S [Luteimonas sp. 100069]
MSLPRYPEYKDSGVEWLGEVPAHWNVDALRRRAALNPSKSEIRELPGDAMVSFLPMEAVGENGDLDLSRTRQISDVLSGYTYFREGDVTFAKITPCFENGKGARMVGLYGGHGFGTTELTVARPDPDLLDSHYLDWVFRSTPFRKRGEAAMYGAGGQKRVPDEFVREFAFGWPSVEEQISIARFLDRETARIDALIAEQETLLALLAEKRQATISHAVTRGLEPNVPMKDSGIAWLGEVPAHWEVRALKSIVATPITDGPHETPVFLEEGVPFVSAEAVSGGAINFDKVRGYISAEDDARYSQKYRPQIHDIYMVKSGATTGVTAIVEGRTDFNIWSPLAAIRCNLEIALPHFVLSYLRSKNFQEGVALNWSFGTQQNIGMGVLGTLPVALPPEDEQRKIAESLQDKLKELAALRRAAERAVPLLRERRSALISAAVTGQIDVRGLVSEEAG